MRYASEQLDRIYERTSGHCHLCHKKLAFKNYGRFGERASWEVEHSVPRARSGTDHLNNLYPACIPCNRSKRDRGTRSMRARNGQSRAPLSASARRKAKHLHAVGGGMLGAIAGSTLGPVGAWIGAAIGAKLGHDSNPDHG